jgi:PAS domain S-box-containing protein
VRGEVLLDAHGRPERAIGVLFDISIKQNALVQSQTSELRCRTLLGSIASVLWTADPDGMVSDIPEWRRLTGRSVAEIQGKGWLNDVHPDDRDMISKMYEHAVTHHVPFHAGFRLRLGNGRFRWINAHVAPVFDTDGNVRELAGAVIDVISRPAPDDHFGKALSGAQARAARAILNWSVKDLAVAARVSVSTVRRLEEFDGPSHLRGDTVEAIKRALEEGGVKFARSASGAVLVDVAT